MLQIIHGLLKNEYEKNSIHIGITSCHKFNGM